MKILLTGGSGFLGKYISAVLSEENELITVGRSPKNTIQADLSKYIPDLPAVDWVIHAASPAHFVPKTAAEEQSFYDTNVGGTQKLLDKILTPPSVFVFISTVAVYGLEEGELIKETQELNPTTPYGKSKVAAEELIQNWAKLHQVKLFILRLPLVVGTNPPGNLSAIARMIKRKMYLRVGKGLNKKSMVLAEDVARLLPGLEDKLPGIYNLCDPDPASMCEIDSALASHYNFKIRSIPEFLLKTAGKLGDLIPFFPVNTLKVSKLSCTLSFDSSKARKELGWRPQSVLEYLKKETII
ncbi:Nucleoside-diphosphate-sugar epimerase [Algoriphagus locisalis]|uniref:Nucleoside-diphosphate-sugar epimerase n=1 Tax=Algoriphagus locisalis TaxID=305507 RepID=A0A1I6XQV5_9BACT|nr:NAD(P)-dependent oxidoreductase [Algoriphagus locisalis]SFT40463.1 Nucleoside-diphosphate-sugar epimerase [Algoriphagus locisalis]